MPGHQSQWVHRFIETEAFGIRPVETAAKQPGALSWHLILSNDRSEFDVARRRAWFQTLDQFAEREASPRNHHGPCFDAAHTVDAIFQREAFDQIIESIGRGLLHQSFNRDGPWPRFEARR